MYTKCHYLDFRYVSSEIALCVQHTRTEMLARKQASGRNSSA